MRRNQIEAWRKEKATSRDEDGCEEIILSIDPNVKRVRRVSDAERRRNEIDRRENEFGKGVAFRWPKHRMLRSNLLVGGELAGIAFIAINVQNENEKIVESFFFGKRY